MAISGGAATALMPVVACLTIDDPNECAASNL
jgi:hypothetical protein